ncbi:1,2-dihydroxy-3-keto-5-methylthiopentene dioxygenase 1 [Hypsizygus marmoreus]|uniref:Acireductone dioxygenase n=1 Tax=Hypsizygus marmoreus TaxID=39966 RepID=A0A369JJN2_HYPMA|nr:1,2-dihydroxy-3-keto-5-methylthiopentene dioxygenase 1 [Hypsizygus marmoreus]
MRAYYYDNVPGDQRLPHDYIPSKPVFTETLISLGVKYWTIPVEGHESKVDAVAQEQGYKNRDTINVSKEGLGAVYEEKIKGFFQEHMHEDEEIRYILGGSGFFDVRETPSDAWIRLAVEPGDLLVIPAGIYHRFTLDEANNIKALRLFKDEPKWIPHNRSSETDINTHRIDYLKSIGVTA